LFSLLVKNFHCFGVGALFLLSVLLSFQTVLLSDSFETLSELLLPPCIRLARGKFELTNHESAGGKNSGPGCSKPDYANPGLARILI